MVNLFWPLFSKRLLISAMIMMKLMLNADICLKCPQNYSRQVAVKGDSNGQLLESLFLALMQHCNTLWQFQKGMLTSRSTARVTKSSGKARATVLMLAVPFKSCYQSRLILILINIIQSSPLNSDPSPEPENILFMRYKTIQVDTRWYEMIQDDMRRHKTRRLRPQLSKIMSSF